MRWKASWNTAASSSRSFWRFCILSGGLVFFLGRDFFPTVDAGQFRLHVRGRAGLRIEETARLVDQVEQEIRRSVPQKEVNTMLDNIGLPYSGINLSYSNGGTIGTSDAEILVSLKPDHHPTEEYVTRLARTSSHVNSPEWNSSFSRLTLSARF